MEVSSDLRNESFASLAEVGRLGEPLESASQRARQKSAGGRLVAYAPENVAPRMVDPM